MASFDFVSFIIGVLLGMILMLLLVWIAYFTRSFLFTYCPNQARPCGGADYYNDPGDALAHYSNITVGEILFLNDNNEMFYRRVPKSTDCVTEATDLVYMKFPQYCRFSSTGGVSETWRETAFNSNIYTSNTMPGGRIVTDGNCDPSPGQMVDSGVPILRWDQNPIS